MEQQTTQQTRKRTCPTCERPVNDWDNCRGGKCFQCKISERLGERDEGPVLAAPALPAKLPQAQAPAAPPPPEPLPPAASSARAARPKCADHAGPCVRCGRLSQVNRRGKYRGYCYKCLGAARMACRRSHQPNTEENIRAWLAHVPWHGPMGKAAPARDQVFRLAPAADGTSAEVSEPDDVLASVRAAGLARLGYLTPAFLAELHEVELVARHFERRRTIGRSRLRRAIGGKMSWAYDASAERHSAEVDTERRLYHDYPRGTSAEEVAG